jgi:hypothetical protein
MADDIVAGTSGAVTGENYFNCDVDAWSARIGGEDTVGYRTFSSDWKTKKNTGYGGSGSLRGTIQFDDEDTEPISGLGDGPVGAIFEAIDFVLTAETGCTYTFTGNLTIVDLQRTSGDRMVGTFNFEADGEISQTWDESA